MAISDIQKIDYLWKKVGYGVTKTDVSSIKDAVNESIPSGLLLRGDQLWSDTADIPSVIPSVNSSVVEIYLGANAVECVEDITSSSKRTWKTNTINWIPPQFGSTYQVKVYVDDSGVADPTITGTQLFAAGSGNSDEWFFDYQSGVLNFIGDNLPTAITGSKVIYIVGAVYVGAFGSSSSNGGSFGDITVGDGGTGTITTASGDLILTSNTGNVIIQNTLFVSNVDTDDSSPITFIPAVTLNSDLSVENNLTVRASSLFESDVAIDANLNVTGNVDIVGNLTLGGNITIGDATTDSITVAADFESNLLPNEDSTYDLGSATKKWRSLYISGNTLFLGGLQLKDDGNGNLLIESESGARTSFKADIVEAFSIETDDIRIDGNVIETINSDSDLELRASGAGVVSIPINDLEVTNNVTITGITDLQDTVITGPVTHTGNTTQIGDTVQTGNFTLLGEFDNGNILLEDNFLSTTNSNSDLELRSNGTGTIRANGVDILKTEGNTFYVTMNGSDTDDGESRQTAFASLKHAMTVAQSGDTIFIAPGLYEEVAPVDFTEGVSVHGSGIRATQFKPTAATRTNDFFRLAGGSVLMDMTLREVEYNSGNDTGYALGFKPNTSVALRSPYIKDVTVLNFGSTVRLGTNASDDPYGFDAADAGRGARVDGSNVASGSIEAAMLFDSVTMFTPNQRGLYITNGARVEWLNSFTYFADEAIVGETGTAGLGGDGKTVITLGGVGATPIAVNDVVTFSSTDGSTVVNMTVESVEDGNKIIVDGRNDDLEGFDFTPASITFAPSGATATSILRYDRKQFAAEMRSIASANVYGNKGAIADGPDSSLRLVSHNFGYIGVGKRLDNDDSAVIQPNEVTETNGGRVYYATVDQRGDFRIGDHFTVDQETGNTTFQGGTFDVTTLTGITFTAGGQTTEITPAKVETGNIRIAGNTVETLTGDLNIDAAGSSDINLNSPVTVSGATTIQDNLNVTGNVDITGDLTLGGNITIGDATTDSVTVAADFESNLVPNASNTYDLGSNTKRWRNLFVGSANFETLTANIVTANEYFGGPINTDDIRIAGNRISTTASNANLELSVNGTGEIDLLDNTNVTGILDVSDSLTVTNSITSETLDINTSATIATLQVEDLTSGRVVLAGTDGEIEDSGNLTFDGTLLDVTGNVTVSGALDVNTDATIATLQVEDLTAGRVVLAGTSGEIEDSANLTFDGTTLNVTGDVDITGDLTLGGNITIGDASTDSITVSADFESNLVPNLDSTYDLGTNAKRWRNLYVGTANFTGVGVDTLTANTITTTTITADEYFGGPINTDDIRIAGNRISTTSSNADLEIVVNGTGNVEILNSTNITGALGVSTDLTANTGDITTSLAVGTTLDVNGQSTLASVNVEDLTSGRVVLAGTDGEIEDSANLTFDGTTLNVTGNVLVSDTFTVEGNTTLGNANTDTVNVVAQIASDLIPDGNGTRNLGSADNAWSSLYVSGNTIFLGSLQLKDDGIGNLLITDSSGIRTDFKVDTVLAQKVITDDITIDGNVIQTTESNSNLEFAANGTGIIDILDETRTTSLIVSDLTATRVVLAGTDGAIEDSANLTFDGTLLDVTGNVTLSGTLDVNTDATIATLQVEDLTSGRVVLAGTSGEIEDSANLTFDGTLLDVTGNVTLSGTLDVNTDATIATLQVEDLTSGRVVLAGASGEIEDSANLTFDGTTLTVTGSLSTTVEATLASAKVSDLTAGRIVLAGTDGAVEDSANLTFDGTTLTVTGDAAIDDITINGSTIATTSGSLVLDPTPAGSAGTVTIQGDLQVLGTTTTIDSTVTTIEDPIITLGGDTAPTSDDTKDKGIEFRWHTGIDAKLGFFGYDRSEEKFTFIPDAVNASEVFSGTPGNVVFGNIEGVDAALSGNTNITGTLSVTGLTTLTDLVAGTFNVQSFTADNLLVNNNANIVGNVSVTGEIYGDGLNTDNIRVAGNRISITDSNADLELISNGTGTIELLSDTNITGDLGISGTLDITNGISSSSIDTGNLQLAVTTDNTVDTSAGNLVLDSVGGTVEINDDATISGTLGVTGESTLASAKISDLTSGRVVLAGIDGAIEDSANLTFDGTLLDVTGNVTLSGTLDVNTDATIATLQVEDLTAGRVVLAGTNGEIEDSANLTFDGTTLNVTGDVDITGDLTLGGNITIGDADTDSITVAADFESNLVPNVDNTYDLGTSDKRWRSLYVSGSTIYLGGLQLQEENGSLLITSNGSSRTNIKTDLVDALRIQTDDISIDGNIIQTTESNSNLELAANGTGFIDILDETRTTSLIVSDLTATRVLLAGTNGAVEDNTNLTFDGSELSVTGDITSTGTVTADNFVSSGVGTPTIESATNINLDAGNAISFQISSSEYARISSTGLEVSQGNLSVTNTLNVLGNTVLGDASTDSVDINGEFISDLVPRSNGIYDLGKTLSRWNNLFAETATITNTVTAGSFSGDLTGNADTANALATARDFSITGAVATASSVSFDGTGAVVLNVTQQNDSVTLGTHTTGNYVATIADAGNTNITVANSGSETAAVTLDLTDTGVTAASYGDASNIPTITVDAKGRVTNVTTNAVATSLSITDGTTTDTVDLINDTLTFTATANETTVAVSDNQVTVGLPDSVQITQNLSVGNQLTVTGNLIVQGTTTTVNSETVTVKDPVIRLGESGLSANDAKDRGTEFLYHTGIENRTGFFGYDNSSNRFTFIPDATNTSEVFAGDAGDAQFNKVYADLEGSVTGNVTGSADTLTTARNFSVAGAVATSAAVSFNGSGDVVLTVAQQNNSVALGTHTTGNYVATIADAGNTNITVVNSGTETAAVTLDLTDTGVTAASYGSTTAIPVITVDAKGRITALTTASITTTLTVAADGGTNQTIDLATETLSITGGTGINTVTGTNTVQVILSDTLVDLTSKSTFGSASLIPSITVNQQGQITSITENSVATSLNITDGTTTDTVDLINDTLTFTATDNETTVVVSDNEVTIGLPDNVTIANNLIVENNGFVRGIFGDDLSYIFDPDNSKYAFGLSNVNNMIGDFEVKSENIVLGQYQNNSIVSVSADAEIIAVAGSSDPQTNPSTALTTFVVASQNATPRVNKGSGAGIAFASEFVSGSNDVTVGGTIRTSKVSSTSAENKFNLDLGQIGDTGAIRFIKSDTTANNPTVNAVITNTGRLGVGTADPGSAVEVVGDVAISGIFKSNEAGNTNLLNLDYDTPADHNNNILLKSLESVYIIIDGDSGSTTNQFGIFANTDGGAADVADGNALLLVNEAGDLIVKNDVTVGNDITITGNLIVQGTTFTVDATTTTTEDPVLRIGVSGLSASDGKDRGIEFLHWDTSAKRGFFGHDESTGRFTYKPNATNTSEVFTGTAGDAEFGMVHANLTGNVTGQVSTLSNHDTGDLSEGTNLYFTTARARAAISVTDAGGDGSLSYNNTTGVITYTGPSAADVRAHFSASGDLTYTEATGVFSVTTYKTADFNTDFGNKSTSDLSEGTRLYFTTTRARNSISVTDSGGDGSLLYNANDGIITYQGPTAAETRAHFNAGGDLAYDSTTGVFSFTERTDSQVRALFSAASPLTYNNTTGEFAFDNTNSGFITLADLSGGTGVTYNNATGEISIGQDVSTTADVEFNDVTVAGQLITDDITVATVTASGNVIVQGDLTVNGTTTTLNTATLDVEDLNITVAKGAADATAANGAGLTVDGASATFTYTSADDRWNLNKDLNVANIYATSLTGDILATNGTKILENGTDGTDAVLTGQVTDISNHDTDDLTEGATNKYFADSLARNALSAGGDLSYDSATGEFSVTTYKSADFDTDFANKNVTELNDVTIAELQPGQYLRYGGVVGDTNYTDVVLLLPFNGNDGDTTTLDESQDANTVTFNGGAEIDTNIKKFGTGSFLGNGTNSYVSATVADGVGTDDFTIEFWIYHDSVVSGIIFNNRTNGTAGDGIDINGSLLVRSDSGSLLNAVSLDTNTWYYVSLSRVDGTLYRHINGVLNASTAFNNQLTGTAFTIGGSAVGNTGYITGNLDDFRVTNGTGRYGNSNYTIPDRQHFTYAGNLGTAFENVTPSIRDLIDIDLTDVQNNSVLIYDAPNNKFKPGSQIVITNIENDLDLTGDLTISGAINAGTTLNLDGITINGNSISTNNSNADIEIGTSGTGTVELLDSTNITGNATVSGTIDVDGQATVASLNVEDLTSTRVVLAGTNGELEDHIDLTFNGTEFAVGETVFTVQAADGNTQIGGTLDVDGATTVADLTVEDLTAGRVVFVGVDSQLVDSTNLTWDGTTFTVTGDASVSGAFDANSITVDTLTDTRLVLAGTNGVLEDDARLTFDNGLLAVDANEQVTGNLEVNGNVDLGLTTSQTVTFNSRVDSSIVPSSTQTYDLGTADLRWNDLYLAGNSVYLGGITLSQGPRGLAVTTSDSGILTNISGNRGLYNALDVGSISIDTNVITTVDSDADLELRTSGAGTIELQDSTNVTGNAAISGTLDVDGQSTLASVNVEDLTDNRIVIAGTSGELEDDANFTFDGTTFNIGATGEFTVAVASGNTQVKGTLDVDGQTTVASLNVEDLTADRITFTTTDGEIKDSANLTFDDSTLALIGDADITGSLDVDDIKIDGTTISSTTGGITIDPDTATTGGTVTIAGNLTVQGTTTTVDSTTVTIDDPIFTLGGDTAPTVNDAKDRGIEFRWYSDTDGQAKLGFFGFDDSTGRFAFRPDTTNTNEVFAGPLGDLDINDIYAQDIAAASLTLTTDLEVQYGGTGASTFTAKGILYGNDANAVQVTAAAGTSDASTSFQILTTDATGTPVWTDTIDEGTY